MSDDLFVFSKEKSSNTKGNVTFHIQDSIDFLKDQKEKGVFYDSIITDPPYEIALHSMKWDNTGIAFSVDFWKSVHDVLKPGGFLAAFGASRLYHRLGVAIEDAGFKLYPMLQWNFGSGLQKPVNVSELFDRENIEDRKIVGYKKGSGYTTANVTHGAQNRETKQFAVYERGESEEAKEWLGWYYGVNCMRPAFEPIVLAQKTISEKRVIDNIRKHSTGALNLAALEARSGSWPTPILSHKKATRADHGSNHPSVKPVRLMEDLCVLMTPQGGHILDMFAGTGTTGVAAQNLGFGCTLVERSPEMAEVISRRLGF